MNRIYCATAVAAMCALTAFGQKTDALPLPVVSPRSIKPDFAVDALTAKEKAKLALRNTFGARSVGNRLLVAGIDQAVDGPEELPGGMEGFGMRFGSRMGRAAVRNSIRLGADVAFNIDPRFDRCLCDGFLARTRHSWRRVFVSRSDSGHEMPAISNFAGAVFTPMITQQWYPDRLNTWGNKWQVAGLELTMRGATNMLREFWPDIRNRLRKRPTSEVR